MLPPLAASLVCRVVGQLLGIALLAIAAWGVARAADHPAAPIAPVM